MIFFSYKFLYKSIFEYYIILLLKKINLPISYKILFAKNISKFIYRNRLLAYADYSQILIKENFKPEIINYRLDGDDINEVMKCDIMDMCKIDYKYIPIYTDSEGIHHKKISYKPDRSGFFSTIFTVINILFYCRFYSIEVYIDWSEWYYDFNIADCFPKNNRLIDSERNYSGQDELFFESRKLLDGFDNQNINYSNYIFFRKKILKKIYENSSIFLNKECINRIKLLDNEIGCFIRRGDKLIRESYPINLNMYISVLKKYKKVVITGDDYYFNENLSRSTGFLHFSQENYRPTGGNLALVEKSAVIAILANFIMLVNSKKIIGDPYCNLVAAAMILKGIDRSYDQRLHPWLMRKYI